MSKIVLIDDDKLMIRMYQTKFKSDGFKVDVAFSGEEGLEKIKSFKPDLVLLDIMMSGMNGLQVLEKIKADESIKSIPVVMLTNVGRNDEDVKKGLELGAVDYLVKAKYTPKEVVQKAKEILSGGEKEE